MTSTPTNKRRNEVVLTSPRTVGAALPHLLGFHPEESLICIWLRRSEIVVVQRADLPAPDSFEIVRDDGGLSYVTAYVEAYLEAAANIRADEVLIICVTRSWDLGRDVVLCTADHVAVRIRSRLVISGTRVRDVQSRRGWTWISADDRQEATRLFGMHHDATTIPRSRQDVVAEVEFDESGSWPPPEDVADYAHVPAWMEVLRLGDWTSPRSRRVLRDAALTVLGRDMILWWCARSASDRRRDLLQALLAGLRATDYGPNLACAAAASAWMCGDGVRANAALERCLREDPRHLMGRLVETAMTAAVPPEAFALMLGDVGPEAVGVDEGVVDELLTSGYSPG